MHFLVSVIAVIGAVSQVIAGFSAGQFWRLADSIYLVVILKWTLSEVLNVIQQSSTRKFSYGYRRISHLFAFAISIFAFFAILRISMYFFKRIPPSPLSAPLGTGYAFVHFVVAVFFLWSPRSSAHSRPQSIIGAVNFNAAEAALTDRFESRDYSAVLALLPAILGPFARSFVLDRLLGLLIVGIVAYLAVPLLRDSVPVLMQAAPRPVSEQTKAIGGELRREVMRMYVWQNDEALVVGNVHVRIDSRVYPKPQDFLMYVISACQHAGILDVTVEVANTDASTFPLTRSLPSLVSSLTYG
jgi:Co/Zn/Cd efflux system component